MRRIPRDRMSATRRQVAQLMVRLCNLAVYPCEILKAPPLPKGFVPKVKSRVGGYLYPKEDAALLAQVDVPLVNRMLYDFQARTIAELGPGPLSPPERRASRALRCRKAPRWSRMKSRETSLVAPPGVEPGRCSQPEILNLLRMPFRQGAMCLGGNNGAIGLGAIGAGGTVGASWGEPRRAELAVRSLRGDAGGIRGRRTSLR